MSVVNRSCDYDLSLEVFVLLTRLGAMVFLCRHGGGLRERVLVSRVVTLLAQA